MRGKLLFAALACALAGFVRGEGGDGEVAGDWYAEVLGALTLPEGGSQMHHVGGAAVRCGRYLDDNWALEAEVAWQEDFVGLSVDALWHWQGCDLYGDLFGYSRFDPFFTFGARGWIGRRGQVGPKSGLGAFYHLTDNVALRFDADATLGLETRCEVDYTLEAGVQYAF